MTDKNASSERSAKSKGDAGKDARAKDSPAAKSETPGIGHSSPKKRRKVNHACVYCRRSHMTCDSERPCTRCIKRNIGHLCHDEPREPTKRRDQDHSAADEEGSSNNELVNVQAMPRNVDVSDAAGQQILSDGTIGIPPSSVQPANIPSSGQGLDGNSQPSKLAIRGS
jgi:hypothetical protein